MPNVSATHSRHAMTERLKTVEQKFERCAPGGVRLFFGEPIRHEIHMLIEERPVARAVGIADNGVFGNDWINFPGGDGMQQAFPNGAPVAVRCSWDRPVRRSFSEGG